MSALKSPLPFARSTRSSGELLPALLCAALLVATAYQAVMLFAPSEPESVAVAPHHVRFLDASVQTDYPAIMNAPLFSIGRQPIADTGRPSTSIEGAEVIGVGLEGTNSVALIRNSDGDIERVHIGQLVEGWKLTAIARDSLTFQRGSERKVMPLVAAPPAAPAQGAKPSAKPADDDSDDSDSDDNN